TFMPRRVKPTQLYSPFMKVRTDPRRHGSSSFNFTSLLRLAATGLTAFSNVPLRLWTIIGGVISLTSIGYAGYIVIETLFYGNDAKGWPTLVVAVSFLGGVQLLSIGILGEYIGRIFTEVKQRPHYFVSRVSRSKVLPHTDPNADLSANDTHA
ncbi:MAG: hypothetical protein ACKO10_07735, partial [Betaproteobacteria bacterium]